MSNFIIYGLIDPRDGQLRYVGKSVSGMNRPKAHMQHVFLQSNTHKVNWIRQLKALGLQYGIVVIQSLDDKEMLSQAEIFWIAYFRQLGCPLTNLTAGGEGMLGHRPSAAHR